MMALAACLHHVSAAPILRSPITERDDSGVTFVCTDADCSTGEVTVVTDPLGDGSVESVQTTDYSVPSGGTGDATADQTLGVTTPTGSVNGTSDVHASLDPGSRTASSSSLAALGPDTAVTGSENTAQNTGNGTAGASSTIMAGSGDATSNAGGGIGVTGNKAGGGAGGGSDALGQGSGGGSGANVVGSNGEVASGIITGADPIGAFVDSITAAIADGSLAVGGTGAGVSGDDDHSISFAITGGEGSNSGAGSGAGPGASGKGVDSGADSSS